MPIQAMIIVWFSRDCKFQIIPENGRVWNPPLRTMVEMMIKAPIHPIFFKDIYNAGHKRADKR